MPKLKYDPAKITDKIDGVRFPLKLIRLCLMQYHQLFENPADIFTTSTGGGGGGTGPGGPPGPPGSTLPTRIQVEWVFNGPYRVDTEVDGAWIVERDCEVLDIKLWRGTAGTSGSTICDVSRRPAGSAASAKASLYATQTNRPTLPYADTDGYVTAPLPDVVLLAAGDIVTIDIDAKDGGRPYDGRLSLVAA